MKRFLYFAIAAAVIGIASEQHSCAAPNVTLPSTAAEWSLAAPQECAKHTPAGPQVWRGTSGARQVCRATYSGSPEMALTLYDMPESPGATAFDALQKWRIQPGKMAFYKGGYFGVVESAAADRDTLNRFVTAVEAALPPGGERRE